MAPSAHEEMGCASVCMVCIVTWPPVVSIYGKNEEAHRSSH